MPPSTVAGSQGVRREKREKRKDRERQRDKEQQRESEQAKERSRKSEGDRKKLMSLPQPVTSECHNRSQITDHSTVDRGEVEEKGWEIFLVIY